MSDFVGSGMNALHLPFTRAGLQVKLTVERNIKGFRDSQPGHSLNFSLSAYLYFLIPSSTLLSVTAPPPPRKT
jgi:hypothetical protein